MEEKLVKTTNSSSLFLWAQKWSQSKLMWSFPVGSACCDPVMEYLYTDRDKSHLQPYPFYDDAKGCDVLIVSGTISKKYTPHLLELYHNLVDQKWVMAIGACAISGGPYRGYSTVNGLEELFPVDVNVYGCPPDANAIYHGIMTLKEKVLAARAEYQ